MMKRALLETLGFILVLIFSILIFFIATFIFYAFPVLRADSRGPYDSLSTLGIVFSGILGLLPMVLYLYIRTISKRDEKNRLI